LETAVPWTNDRLEVLKKLWTDGLSASAIAARLGDTTRNAVIGKARRLGLAGRAGTARRTPRSGRPFPLSARSWPKTALRTRSDTGLRTSIPAPRKRVSLPDLGPAPERPVNVSTLSAESCRWPEGDPKHEGFHFCGRAAEAGRPYCRHHAAIAYR
jgi:GcrA cell cycle regulator